MRKARYDESGNPASGVSEMAKSEPVKRFRVGSVTAAVWKNGDDNYSVTVQKSYKDGNDWKNTDTLFHGDVVCAVRALERAEEYIASM